MSKSSFSKAYKEITNLESMEMTFTINDADLDKLNEILKDINVNECPWFEVQDKHGNKAKYYREPQWIPCSERLPSKEERKEWIDNNLGGIGYLYPCLVTRYSSINPDRTKNNPYVAKHYFDGEDFLNAGEEVCSEYIIAWMPLPEPYNPESEESE
jgi:hypothetical protein